MRSRRCLGIAMVVALAFSAGACGGNNDNAQGADGVGGDTGSGAGSTPARGAGDDVADSDPAEGGLSDQEFAARIEKINATLEGAGSNLCIVMTGSLELPPAAPSSKAQVKLTVDTYARVMETAAAALPAGSEASAKTLNQAASDIRSAAEKADYPDDFLTGRELAAITGSKEFAAASGQVNDASRDCNPAEPPTN